MPIENEEQHLATTLTALPTAQRALVIAPHPDDEVFGCGGTLSLLRRIGCVVSVVVVTDGALGGDNSGGRLVEVRAAESRAAAAVLGLDAPVFWGLPDRGVDYGEALVERIIAVIQETDAELVFLPSPAERHPDHQAIAFAGAEAIRRIGGSRQAAFYEVSEPLPCPNLILDISAAEADKRRAMQCFQSQLQEQPYDTRIAGINSYRAFHLGAQVTSAEAFTLVSSIDLGDGLATLLDGPLAYRRRLGFAATGSDIPLVSVIVRSMDRPTLPEALDSVALQTYSNIELLLVNAKGPGHSRLDPWCGRFPLRFIDSPRQVRRSEAANLALDAAGGDYLVFLDDDDWLLPDHVSTLLEALKNHPGKHVAYGCVTCTDEKKLPTEQKFCQPFDRTRLLVGNYIPIHAVLFSRAIVAGGCRMNESLDLYEDWDFWLQALAFGDFVFVNRFIAAYRIGGQSGQGVHASPVVVQETLKALLSTWSKTWQPDDLWNIMIRVAGYDDKAQANLKLQQQTDLLLAQKSELETQYAGLQQQHSAVQLQHTELHLQYTELHQQYLEVHQQNTELQQQQTNLQQLVDALQQLRTGMEQQLSDLQHQNASLQLHHAEMRHMLDQMLHSSSWRLTAPLRRIRQTLTGAPVRAE